MISKRGFITLDDLDVSGKRILVRVDFNVPLIDGAIQDDSRIRACLPTINKLLDGGAAAIMLLSHFGRPKEGSFDAAFSLNPVAEHLSSLINRKVRLAASWQNDLNPENGEIVLLENIRFSKGEKADDEQLSKQLAGLCDIFVNDAFAVTHRVQASTHGVAKFAPVACAGPLLLHEINTLSNAFEQPARPFAAIVGGSKVSTKLTLLDSLLNEVDQLILGGGIINTFLKAKGYNIGNSLHEDDLVHEAQKLLLTAEEQGKAIPIPVDVVCGKEFSNNTKAIIRRVSEIEDDDLIMDVGPETSAIYADILKSAATIIWNGPLGVFEFEPFSNGTKQLANAIADSQAFSVAGGGDTISAITKFGVTDRISYISTGGGAFLEFLEGKKLPALDILEQAARKWRTAHSPVQLNTVG